MLHETVLLQVPGAEGPTELVTYVPGNFPELGLDRRRPGLIICPGGGYAFRSDREGEPVALRFAGLGYAAFILNYHVAPQGRWPIPQRQLLAAIDHVRTNCDASGMLLLDVAHKRWSREMLDICPSGSSWPPSTMCGRTATPTMWTPAPWWSWAFPPAATWRAAPGPCGTSRRSTGP